MEETKPVILKKYEFEDVDIMIDNIFRLFRLC